MLAREAYIKKNYAEPSDSSAIVYTKRALALDATDNYSKKLLEDSVQGGKYQVQQAIAHKDFAGATRLANALAKLLPGRRDIAGLKEDIAAAQTAAARLRPRSRPTP